MHILNYIIWNGSPELISIGPITLRWYGLLFAMGFLISQQILYYMFKAEGKPQRDVDTLTIYMVIATIVGARLGHIIFYEPEMFLKNPLRIILPFQFTPEFHFTGYEGLASHGGAFGILFALWLYSRKKKPGQNYLQTLDRIVILVALTGALIRFGNFFNSEILGKPYHGPTGVVFISRLTDALKGDPKNQDNLVQTVVVEKDNDLPKYSNGRVPLKVLILFNPGVSQANAEFFCRSNVKSMLFYLTEFADSPTDGVVPFQTIYDEKSNQVLARVGIMGISRHPAQLYESISCVFLFAFLFYIWWRHKNNLPEGRIFGYFMIILWSLRFGYEYLKTNQVPFEDQLPLNMGQILSIPLVIVGVFILIRSYRKSLPNS